MEVAAGVVSSVITKLGELLVGEYNLQKGVKGGIKFLQSELESIQGALEKISRTPTDQLDNQDKIWARDVRELSYDIDDKIDTFMVHCKGSRHAKGFTKIIDRSLDLLMRYKTRRKIANDIIDIKCRVKDVSERRDRYMIRGATSNPVSATIDPRLFVQYTMVTELVGIDEARDEVINILMDGNEVSKQQDKIVSIVGLGGLGKTTLANAVYEKIREQFDCSAFASVSRTPSMEKLFKGMLRQLDEEKYGNINLERWEEGQLIHEFRELLLKKRYLIVIDDVWDIMVWKMIKCALPEDNVGFKIIATTRILSVAEDAGLAYKMKPLSLENSRKLLYERTFSKKTKDNNDEPKKCPDEELAEVSDRILKKCAGVPLAIVTISSLLASKGRSETEWYKVYNSIGTGMENSLDTENMRKILSFSYYDLPFHLRTCLLYLSLFPEDYEVQKEHLIWMWISEGFIQYEKGGKRLFDVGEGYLNELINRGMIQPLYSDSTIEMIGCRVHDMVLDLICSLSNEENFVTILNDVDHTFPSKTVRRLTIQNGKVDGVMDWDTRSVKHIRSVVSFRPLAAGQMAALRSFKVLRVLDLYTRDLLQGNSLKYLGSLFHLRYLRLRGTRISELPEEVGNLQFLETLDVEFASISRLPLTVSQLTRLLCLSACPHTRIPNKIGSLRCLEELSWLCIDDESADSIEELSLLTELRVLRIVLSSYKWLNKLVECLCKLQKIQSLRIQYFPYDQDFSIGGFDAWVTPRQLRSLDTQTTCCFSELPAWMNNPSHLPDLSVLEIAVRELQQEELEILGRLPSLRYLNLKVDHGDLETIERFVVTAGSFPGLVRCKLWGFVGPVVFQQGAMPRLTRLELDIHVWEAREISGRDGGFMWSLGNLPSLQYVEGLFRCIGTCSKEEVDEARAAVRKVGEIHPNCSTLRTKMKIIVTNCGPVKMKF